MTDAELLELLKIDLQISTNKLDSYLAVLIAAARGYIAQEGAILTGSAADGMLVVMYAAYLYRRRREENQQMPRMLRWALNNRVFGGGGGAGG